MPVAERVVQCAAELTENSGWRKRPSAPVVLVADNPGVAKVVFSSASKQSTVSRRARASVDARRGRGRVGSQPGGGLMFQSGCPAGSAFQNMILSK
jgi:hypothetical protein